jgi:hypothetical protein
MGTEDVESLSASSVSFVPESLGAAAFVPGTPGMDEVPSDAAAAGECAMSACADVRVVRLGDVASASAAASVMAVDGEDVRGLGTGSVAVVLPAVLLLFRGLFIDPSSSSSHLSSCLSIVSVLASSSLSYCT